MIYILSVIDSCYRTSKKKIGLIIKINTIEQTLRGRILNSGLFKALSLLGLTWLSLMTKFIQTELRKKMSVSKTKPNPCET